jgi:hypothetical protein
MKGNSASDHNLPEQKRSEILPMMPFWLLAAVDWVFCHIEFQRMKTSESDAAEELSTQFSKSKHEIDPRLAKPVSHSAS